MVGELVNKAFRSLRWLPAYAWQRCQRGPLPRIGPLHLLISVADHFEPAIIPHNPRAFANLHEQEVRLERWCKEYPKAIGSWRDDDGRPFRHTYFYPVEQYDKGLIEQLADHCRAGWGEIEIQLHHGVEAPDSAVNLRHTLIFFRDTLASHGCLSRWEGKGPHRYGFVHGNWALANSAGGRYCGVDEEMEILSETGCYADFTLPSAPNSAQVGKINSLYECSPPLSRRAPHRRGQDLQRGRPPQSFPLIVQGPLGLNCDRRINGWRVPCIENGALTSRYPPTIQRVALWIKAGITVHGRPNWLFIKLHCHGMDARDEEAMLGWQIQQFLAELTGAFRAGGEFRIHFLTARETVNVMLAACDGRDGSPREYFDYRLKS